MTPSGVEGPRRKNHHPAPPANSINIGIAINFARLFAGFINPPLSKLLFMI
jgi:hypothetical protein